MSRSPLTAVPAQRSSLPVLKLRRRLVLGGLGLAIVTSVFSGISWLTFNPPATVATRGSDLSVAALAHTVAADFLAGRTSAVPGTKGVSTDFAASQRGSGLRVDDLTLLRSSAVSLGDRAPTSTVQMEEFSALVSGRLFTVGVPMLFTSSGWVVAAEPSLTPTPVGVQDSGNGINYSDLYSTGITDSQVPPLVTAQVQKWATAFASGKGLDDVVQDPTPGHTYTGLNGWTATEVTVTGAVAITSEGSPAYIVRAALVLHPPGSNGPTLSSSYDLLIEPHKRESAPPVTAWGPPGSYHSLLPYQNAQ